MDFTIMPNQGAMNMEEGRVGSNGAQVNDYNRKVDELLAQVDKLEQRVNEIEQFYINIKLKESNTSRNPSMSKDKEKEKNVPSMKKLQLEASHREAATAKRMQELMRQFGSIFCQITQHKWHGPLCNQWMLKDLVLHVYYQGDVYGMAKALLEKFEEKWLQLLPKVMDEEKRREEEEAEGQKNMILVQEAAHAKMARDLNNETHVYHGEKKARGCSCQIVPTNLSKALDIVAQNNSNFQSTADELELTIISQSESTLWRLKFFIKDILEGQCGASTKDTNNNTTTPPNVTCKKRDNNIVSRRKN